LPSVSRVANGDLRPWHNGSDANWWLGWLTISAWICCPGSNSGVPEDLRTRSWRVCSHLLAVMSLLCCSWVLDACSTVFYVLGGIGCVHLCRISCLLKKSSFSASIASYS
jgi:hypothetical protein